MGVFVSDATGRVFAIHREGQCLGQTCCFHNPSDHKMKDWPKILRESTLVERLCVHGIGHPDPDSVAYLGEGFGVHGCDGCCR